MSKTNESVQSTETETKTIEAKTEVKKAPVKKDPVKKARTESEKVKMDRLCKDLPTKSAKIRVLNKSGYTRSQIAKYLDIRYQHVRNVLITPLVSEQKTK